MNRFLPAAAFALLTLSVPAMYAQTPVRSMHSTFSAGRIDGRVLDDKQAPVVLAMVSVVGRATAVTTTGSDGQYSRKIFRLALTC